MFLFEKLLLFRVNSGENKKNAGINIGRPGRTLPGTFCEGSSDLSQVPMYKSAFSFRSGIPSLPPLGAKSVLWVAGKSEVSWVVVPLVAAGS